MDISPQELKKRLELKDSDLVIIDVREDWEFEEFSIAHHNISLYKIPEKINEFQQWQNKDIIVHCNSGKRSRQAQKYLRKNGFENVINLIGGLDNYLNHLK